MGKAIIKIRICWKKCEKLKILTVELSKNSKSTKVIKLIIGGITFKNSSRKPK